MPRPKKMEADKSVRVTVSKGTKDAVDAFIAETKGDLDAYGKKFFRRVVLDRAVDFVLGPRTVCQIVAPLAQIKNKRDRKLAEAWLLKKEIEINNDAPQPLKDVIFSNMQRALADDSNAE